MAARTTLSAANQTLQMVQCFLGVDFQYVDLGKTGAGEKRDEQRGKGTGGACRKEAAWRAHCNGRETPKRQASFQQPPLWERAPKGETAAKGDGAEGEREREGELRLNVAGRILYVTNRSGGNWGGERPRERRGRPRPAVCSVLWQAAHTGKRRKCERICLSLFFLTVLCPSLSLVCSILFSILCTTPSLCPASSDRRCAPRCPCSRGCSSWAR